MKVTVLLPFITKLWFSPDNKDNGGDDKKDPSKKEEANKSDDSESVTELSAALKKERAEKAKIAEALEREKASNKELVAQIINGEDDTKTRSGDKTPETKEESIAELRKTLYGKGGKDLTNLAYVSAALKLRKAVLEKGGPDPFLPHGVNIKPNEEDKEKANNVADVLEACVIEANGDSGVFTALLQARINNDSPALTSKLKKLGLLRP